MEESREEESQEDEPPPEPVDSEEPDLDAPEFTTQATKIDDIQSDTFGTMVSEANLPPLQEVSPANGEEAAIEAEKAMAGDDDGEVLRVLRGESFPVWETLRASGWYDIKKADLALAPIELFYSIAGEAGEKQRSGADAQDLKSFLEDWGFSKLLLSLREMFMRHNL